MGATGRALNKYAQILFNFYHDDGTARDFTALPIIFERHTREYTRARDKPRITNFPWIFCRLRVTRFRSNIPRKNFTRT